MRWLISLFRRARPAFPHAERLFLGNAFTHR